MNKHNQIAAFIGDNTDNFIYIIDPDTYDMLHMNKKALHMYGNPSEEEWRSKKCYEILHGKTEPCEFCTNNCVTEHEFYEWNYYNPKFERTYLFRDKLIVLDGKIAKLQVATDITKLISLEKELTEKLDEQNLLIKCIKRLQTYGTPDESIEKILGAICGYFAASRAVVMQISTDGLSANDTHEWTDETTKPRKQEFQDLPFEFLKPFFHNFNEEGVLYCDSIEDTFGEDEVAYSILKNQGIDKMLCVSVINSSGDFVGMLKVDNPSANLDKHWLLASLSVFIADFFNRNKYMDSLNRLSYYDVLTGVKNRHSYTKVLTELDEKSITSLGVVYVDITRLSRINEEKGIRYGDQILKKMAWILTEIFGDDIFRVDGDEFVALAKNIDEIDFEHMINQLKNTIFEENDMVASIGFTWNGNFEAKEGEDAQGDDHVDRSLSYDSLTGSKTYTTMLSKNLDREIKNGKYLVFLQPQIDLKTKKLDGAEALIRRLDASGNIQSPNSFVPFYEKEGLISKIDFYVFETICKLINDWRNQEVDCDFKVSVNCSRNTIMKKNIAKILAGMCEKYSVRKSQIIVEITETISHSDDKVFTHVLTELRNEGFSVSLDDFGVGYSNLTSLKLSDFDEIKIDMGLTRDVHLDDKSKILAKVALNLCKEFEGMTAVAEGIETIEQFQILKDLDCEKGQGYYFSKPLKIQEFEEKYF